MFYYGEPPPLGVLVVVLLVVGVLLFGMVQCDRANFQDNWANKVVLVNAIQQEGIVIGGGSSRDQGRMLSIRLKNGNIIKISANQVTVLPEQKTPKEIEIERVQSELKSKQDELNRLKEAK